MAIRASQIFVEVGADTDQAERGLKRTDDLIDKLGDTAGKTGRSFTDRFTLPLLGVAGVLVGAGGAAIGVASDYQDSMALLEAASSASESEMAALGARAKELGSDLTLPGTSAGDAGLAMLELSKAGLTVDETLKAAKGTLQLSAAANIDNAKAAEINANALNSFALSGDKAVMVADLLAAGANASSMEVTDMADGFAMASAVFAQMQSPAVGAENAMIDLSTSMAVMANAGVKGSDAGTSLKQMLLMLAGPSDKAKALMKELAVGIGESGDIAYDANGKMRPFKEIVELTAKATADMTEEQRNAAIVQIFGADASRAAMIMMKATGDAARETGKDFDSMREKVTKQGAAGDMAAARMQGLSGAIGGLGSQLETAALVGIEPFLPLLEQVVTATSAWVSELTDQLGPAAATTAEVLSTVIGFLAADGVPIMYALGAATATYATIATVQALPAIAALISAHAAQAIATAAAVAPYALMAAAIYGVVNAYDDFDSKAATATTQLLESRAWWTQGTAALDAYSGAAEGTQAKLSGLAEHLQQVREQQQLELESLGKRSAAGLVSQEQYQQEMATINSRAESLKALNGVLSAELAKELEAQAASQGLISTVQTHTAAEGERAQAVELTAKEMAKLVKELEEIRDASITTINDITNADVAFLDGLESRRATHEETMLALIKERNGAKTSEQRKAIDDKIAAQQAAYAQEQQNQALAYAQELAAQIAHQGQQLLSYIDTQEQMGRIGSEKAGQLREAITREYGITQSQAEITYGQMITSIDAWAASTSENTDVVIGQLTDLRLDSIETKKRMDELAKTYTAELVQNFNEGKLDAESYALALAKIPSRVQTQLEIERLVRDASDPYGYRREAEELTPRAVGGPVVAGQSYLVGEDGPERFTPNQSGTITPAGLTAGGMGQGGGMVDQRRYEFNITQAPESTQTLRDTVRMIEALG